MPWQTHKQTTQACKILFQTLILITVYQGHTVYLSNRPDSCTSERHGIHFGLLNAHLNSIPLSKASCFTLKKKFKIFCLVLILPGVGGEINGYETNTLFTSNLNGYKEWRRNKQKDPCNPPSPLSTFCSHTVIQPPCPLDGFSCIKL